MIQLEWKDEYNLGVDDIDKQHQKLFDYLRELRDMMRNEDTKGGIAQTLDNLYNYGVEHFTFEEQLMERIGFSALEGHRKLHTMYNQRLDEFRKRFQSEDMMATELLVFIKEWLLNHILKEDKKYALFMKENDIES